MTGVEEILDRLVAKLGRRDGDPVALDGGITNRNFRVTFGGRAYVVRLPGKDTELLGISREAERMAAEAAARLSIGPAVAAAEPDCLVTEYVPCTPVGPGELATSPEPVAKALRAFHDCGVELPVRFWVPDLLDRYASVVRSRGGALPDGYVQMQALVRRISDVLSLEDPVPSHDDLLAGNVLRSESGEFILVDWEYAGMGHRLFDLGNLAVNHDLDEPAERRLLSAYFGEPASERQWAALRLMRIVSDARESAWGVVQTVLSELEFDFDGYAAQHHARLASAAEDPRLEEWLDVATAA